MTARSLLPRRLLHPGEGRRRSAARRRRHRILAPMRATSSAVVGMSWMVATPYPALHTSRQALASSAMPWILPLPTLDRQLIAIEAGLLGGWAT